MRKLIAADLQVALATRDIRTLVNVGRLQSELCSPLPPAEQECYRTNFTEGIHAFLFRDLPPGQTVPGVAAPDSGSRVAEVTDCRGKVLRLMLQRTPAGLRIVMVERG